MKILMVSSFLPYPLFNGGNVRLYNLLKNLSKKYQVTLICEKRGFQTKKDVLEISKFCDKVLTVDRKKQWSFSNIIKSGFSFDSFLIVGHTSSKMKRKIKEELEKGNYDLIHVETSYIMQNLPETSVPIVLVEHNIEYLVYQIFAKRSLFFLKPFLNWDVFKLANKEKKFWKKAKTLVAVSEKEKELMGADAVVPNGVDTEKFSPKTSNIKEKRILFIGEFKWLENRDSARWILKEIWPDVKSKIRGVKLWIVGRNIPESIKRLGDSDVIFDENAPSDTSLIYNNSFVLLAPIRIGGGTSFKILEAMGCGIPVITTSLGAEGITKGKEVVRADTLKEVSETLLKLYNDKKYYEDVSKNARELIKEKFDWKNIVKKLENVYESTLKK